MAISFVNAGTKSEIDSGTLSPGIPSGTQADDILICVAVHGGTAAFTWPGDWTMFLFERTTRVCEVGWKRAVGGDSSPSITSGTASCLACIAGYRGVKTSGSPFTGTPVIEHHTGTGLNLNYPAITPAVADSEYCIGTGAPEDWTVAGWSGTNPTPAERFDELTTLGTVDGHVSLASGLKTDTSSGGARTATATGTSDIHKAFTFALEPAAAAELIAEVTMAPLR